MLAVCTSFAPPSITHSRALEPVGPRLSHPAALRFLPADLAEVIKNRREDLIRCRCALNQLLQPLVLTLNLQRKGLGLGLSFALRDGCQICLGFLRRLFLVNLLGEADGRYLGE